MTAVATEHVLVVPTHVFHALGHFQGFCGDTDRYLNGLLDPAHTSYRPRSAMEQDPSFKQLIPYVIFRHRDAGGQTLACFNTPAARGKARPGCTPSGASASAGIFRPTMPASASAYDEGMRRELEEEVVIDTPYTVAAGRPDQRRRNRGGQASTWASSTCSTSSGRPCSRAKARSSRPAFGRSSELLADLSRFETWSQICLKALFA